MAYQIARFSMTLSRIQDHSSIAKLNKCDQQLTTYQRTQRVARSRCDSWASCNS